MTDPQRDRTDGPSDRPAGRGESPADLGWGRYLSHGLSIAVGGGLGAWGGSWLDHKYGWTPWGAMVGAVLGFGSGMYLLIRDALRANKY